MEHWNKFFPSDFVSSEDLLGREVSGTIEGVVMQSMGDQEGEKPVVKLKGCKDLVLNKTNASVIANMYGNDYTLWRGKSITLHAADVMFKGRMVKGVRVRQYQVAGQPTVSSTGGVGGGGAAIPLSTNDQPEIPLDDVPTGKLNVNQQQTLKNLYQNNDWPVDEVRRMIKEVADAESLGQIGAKHYQTLIVHFGKEWISDENQIDADDLPF